MPLSKRCMILQLVGGDDVLHVQGFNNQSTCWTKYIYIYIYTHINVYICMHAMYIYV